MRRARDVPSAIINLRIAVAETLGANRDTIIKKTNIMLGLGFGAIVLVHYAVSYDRIFWLLKK